MYRSNWLNRALSNKCLRQREQIPYVIIGGVGFYKRREVKDLLAYLRLDLQPGRPRSSFGRVINTPARGIGDKVGSRLPSLGRSATRLWRIGEALERLFYDDPVCAGGSANSSKQPYRAPLHNMLGGMAGTSWPSAANWLGIFDKHLRRIRGY